VPLPRDDEWPVWTRIDAHLLEHAQGEEPFFETAIALATEFGQLTELLARAAPAARVLDEPHDRLLLGLAVRTVKLTRRLIAETFEGRGEVQALLDRELFETVSDAAYVLRGGPERSRALLRDSLRADARVLRHLDNNRASRGGESLPLEDRMRARLEASFELAGVPREEVDAGAGPDWPSIEDRLAAVGEPDAHAMHQLGADVVHGLWNELLAFHLDAGEAGTAPRLDWSSPRVQPLHAVAIQGSRVMAAYARNLGHDVAAAFRDKYLELAHRAAEADRMHEEYLARANVRLDLPEEPEE
jgi:hypothetical protein